MSGNVMGARAIPQLWRFVAAHATVASTVFHLSWSQRDVRWSVLTPAQRKGAPTKDSSHDATIISCTLLLNDGVYSNTVSLMCNWIIKMRKYKQIHHNSLWIFAPGLPYFVTWDEVNIPRLNCVRLHVVIFFPVCQCSCHLLLVSSGRIRHLLRHILQLLCHANKLRV